ncbi:helix-turn-helix domain-containing protein [Kineosporia babensis]|uniref:Helix-turn-helix domain-containing protein n=1 Tax=Kineosporia babensis TaxID=499548 RepID=A0A9X1NL41_9ACTN|nr:helix-turn-helix domain-containing protein [Kineosporia babensis]MCD5316163.1 helix-turn-helix domain-containing protein [Kineosporia babensis]
MEGVDRLWTHEETASFLHVSVWRLHHLVADGAGPAMYWVGSQRRYDPVEVRSWLREQQTLRPTAPASTPRAVRLSPSSRTCGGAHTRVPERAEHSGGEGNEGQREQGRHSAPRASGGRHAAGACGGSVASSGQVQS